VRAPAVIGCERGKTGVLPRAPVGSSPAASRSSAGVRDPTNLQREVRRVGWRWWPAARWWVAAARRGAAGGDEARRRQGSRRPEGVREQAGEPPRDSGTLRRWLPEGARGGSELATADCGRRRRAPARAAKKAGERRENRVATLCEPRWSSERHGPKQAWSESWWSPATRARQRLAVAWFEEEEEGGEKRFHVGCGQRQMEHGMLL
jgi:hypothetical protein